jgi:hypothetical protein
MLARTAGSSALAPAPAVEWDDLQAAPDTVRHGPITFPDDVDGWCQALIWLTTGWTATRFFATKPKAEHDKYWGQAKQHFQKGHHVPVLLDKYQPGGWWYTHDWRGQKGEFPRPEQVIETWGQWTRPAPTPNGNGHPRAAPMTRHERNLRVLEEHERRSNGGDVPPPTGTVEGRVIRYG